MRPGGKVFTDRVGTHLRIKNTMLLLVAHAVGGRTRRIWAFAPVRQRLVQKLNFTGHGGAHIEFPVAHHGKFLIKIPHLLVQGAAVQHADWNRAIGAE